MALDVGQQKSSRQYGRLVAQVWQDPALKQRLLESPAAVLAEAGITIPSGTEPRIVENTEHVTYVVLPRQPGQGELSDEQLQQVPVGYHASRPGDEA